ncbi:MAG: hypothetical protein OHK0045_24640 [Raineya sp.]
MVIKNKLKKIGVLALVLANFVIFAPQEVKGQKKSIDISDPPNGNNRHWVQYTINFPGVGAVEFYGCVNGGSDCFDDISVNG